MKYKLLLLLALAATNLMAAPPIHVNGERTVHATLTNTGDTTTVTNAVMLQWQVRQPQTQQITGFEIQRKLFLWGWRTLARPNHQANLWVDLHPAKRSAWYRVRATYNEGQSPWSNQFYAE